MAGSVDYRYPGYPGGVVSPATALGPPGMGVYPNADPYTTVGPAYSGPAPYTGEQPPTALPPASPYPPPVNTGAPSAMVPGAMGYGYPGYAGGVYTPPSYPGGDQYGYSDEEGVPYQGPADRPSSALSPPPYPPYPPPAEGRMGGSGINPAYPPPEGLPTVPPPAPTPAPLSSSTALQPAGKLSPAVNIPPEMAFDTGGFDQGVRRGPIGAPSATSPEPRPYVYGDPNAMRGTMPGLGQPTVSEGGFTPKVTTTTGGPSVTVETQPGGTQTAISEPPTYSPTELRLRGARGHNPMTAFDDDAGYPPVTPKVVQSPTRYNKLKTDDPYMYEAVNSVAAQLMMSPVDLFNMAYARAGTDKDGKISLDYNNAMGLTSKEMAEADPLGEHARNANDVLENLFLGGKLYMYWRDYFGANTASAIAAAKYGLGPVNAAAQMLPGDQQESVLRGFRDFVHKATGNDADDAKRVAVPSAQPAAQPEPQQGGSGARGRRGLPAGTPETTTTPASTAPAAPAAAEQPTRPGFVQGEGGTVVPAPVAPAPSAPAGPGGVKGLPPHVPPLGSSPGSTVPSSTAPPGPTSGTPPSLPAPDAGSSAPSSPSTPNYQLTGGGNVTPSGLVRAGSAGPQTFMTYMVNNAPAGMNTGDMWRHSATVLSNAFILAGDMQGAQRAQEFVFQQAHVGSVQALMQAYTTFQGGRGDLQSTAQLLAKAHAFFPDGTVGAFQVIPPSGNQPGQILGMRFDEETGRPIGSPFAVTNEMLAGAINQTVDPQKWLETLRQHQQLVETKRHNEMEEGIQLRGQDVTQRGQDVTFLDVQERAKQRAAEFAEREEDRRRFERERIEAQNERTRLAEERKNEEDRQRLAIALGKAGAAEERRVAQIDNDVKDYLGGSSTVPEVMSMNSAQRGQASVIMRGLLQGDPASTPPQAFDAATGLMPQYDPAHPEAPPKPSRYQVSPSKDGTRVAIVGRDNPNDFHGYLPMNMAVRFRLIAPPTPQGGGGGSTVNPNQMQPPQ